MISALIASTNGPGAPPLADDLATVGVTVKGHSSSRTLLADTIRGEPDIVVIYEGHPDGGLFEAVAAVSSSAPRPVVMFTLDPDADKIALATDAGVHAYVIDGYRQNRLRAVIHLAQARFRREQRLVAELAEVNQKFAERVLVDRAKGILMGSRQLREEEAFRALRSAAMHGKRRIGQVAREVIEAARYGEAINRAGQLRMLSQRLVKLYALACGPQLPPRTADLFTDSLAQVDRHLASLGKALSGATFGDLLSAVLTPWNALRAALAVPANLTGLTEVDRLAETMLQQAEQLTLNLEVAGFAAALHVINVSGRQRMLSQRMAKAMLMGELLRGPASAAAQAVTARTRDELIEGFDYLGRLPLSNDDIARGLAAARVTWAAFERATAPAEVALLSEELLGQFDRLTDHLERGMQRLV